MDASTIEQRPRRACFCGCGLEFPALRVEVVGDAEVQVVEVVLGHHAGRPAALVAAQVTLARDSGLVGFRLTTAPDGEATWRPLFPEEFASVELSSGGSPHLHPAEWDGIDGAAPRLIERLDPLFASDEAVRWHLDGPSDPNLDLTFLLPDLLLGLEGGPRRSNQNFATLKDRRFLRALLPLPLLGAAELRVGVWFEVTQADFDEVYEAWEVPGRYLPLRIAGTAANQCRIAGTPLLGQQMTLAPRTAEECLFVMKPSPALEPLWRRPLDPASFRLVREEVQRSQQEALRGLALGAVH